MVKKILCVISALLAGVGFFVALGAIGGLEQTAISFIKTCGTMLLGTVLMIIGTAFTLYFGMNEEE